MHLRLKNPQRQVKYEHLLAFTCATLRLCQQREKVCYPIKTLMATQPKGIYPAKVRKISSIPNMGVQ